MKKYLCISAFWFLIFGNPLSAQLPGEYFTHGANVGNPTLKGSFDYHSENQVFTLKGSGYNIWFERDEFFFLSKPVEGDVIFSASLAFDGAGVDPHRKMGLMLRESTADDAPYVDVAVHGDGLTSLQFRRQKGGTTEELVADVKAPGFVQLERRGNTFILRVSKDHAPLREVAVVEVPLERYLLGGMFVSAHNPEVLEQARFWNVRFDVPAGAAGGENAPASPSRLEILEVETGHRQVLWATEKHIEAPNWSRDGKFLLYNSDGKLFRLGLKSKTPVEIHTGFADANNNDHGISFDGKMLAISHHTVENENRHSIIYTVPVTGGTPRRITEKGPSYWHGWSPDDKWLTYCAERNGEYDVYKIPAAGGEEIRLTQTPGLDDGPEYSPDGKYIYFNSVRSGNMQIWRMQPDGSNPEQVTFDGYNNWFAHPSPDGRWLIYISYLPEVPPGSHPRNQRVMLRLQSVETGEVKALAFLYGGQGTLNVPSWSPDSRKVAFVSYTY